MSEKQKKVLEALGKVVAKLSDAKLAELAAYGEGIGQLHGLWFHRRRLRAYRTALHRDGAG